MASLFYETFTKQNCRQNVNEHIPMVGLLIYGHHFLYMVGLCFEHSQSIYLWTTSSIGWCKSLDIL